jgi:hypothetical protein
MHWQPLFPFLGQVTPLYFISIPSNAQAAIFFSQTFAFVFKIGLHGLDA